MGREQSPRTRTIAASRGDDNRDEPPARDSRPAAPIDHNETTKRPGENAPRYRYAKNPEGNRFSLTGSFRNGHLALSKLQRRGEPERATCFRLRTHVDLTSARKWHRNPDSRSAELNGEQDGKPTR